MLLCKANFKFIYASASEEVLPEDMTAVLSSAVKLVECNPRGMKRIVNLLQIISVLGRIRPHDDLLSFTPIAISQEKEWKLFLNKCVLWIVLCQYFPYRVSLLVQILLDFDQKIIFNAKASKAIMIILYDNCFKVSSYASMRYRLITVRDFADDTVLPRHCSLPQREKLPVVVAAAILRAQLKIRH